MSHPSNTSSVFSREFRLGDWLAKPQLNRLESGEHSAHVESKSMAVLVELASRAGEVCSRRSLIRAVWADTFVTDQVLTHAIWELRRVFNDQASSPRFIQTVARKGYRLVAPVSWLGGNDKPTRPKFPYRIIERLGSGGMGLVYRAEDTFLGRSVALKFLREEYVEDESAKARFLREAKAAAALDHPNIGVVFEAGESPDGRLFIAMAYYPGGTLKQRLARGRLPIEEVLDFGQQIAGGLAAAHGHGVIHRDVKPSNVVVSTEGHARLIDFGLARFVGDATVTKAGGPPGSVAYMAPERLRGGTPDHRVDNWALGVLLYEMVEGELPFKGDSAHAVMHAVLNDTPNRVGRSRDDVPDELASLIQALLTRNRDLRLGTAGEAVAILERLTSGASPKATASDQIPSELATAGRRARRGWRPGPSAILWFTLSALVALSGIMVDWRSVLVPSTQGLFAGPVFFEIKPPPQLALTEGERNVPAISPDGASLVFLASDSSGRSDLWHRPLGKLEAELVPGAQDASLPFWLADGRSVAFFSHRQLIATSLTQGGTRRLATATLEARGGSWGKLGQIVYAPGPRGPLEVIQSSGGEAKHATWVDAARGELGHLWPQFLPNGRRFIFFVSSHDSQVRGIYWTELGSEDKHLIRNSDTSGIVVGQHLLYLESGQLFAQPIDTLGMRLLDVPTKLLDAVAATTTLRPAVAASESGVLVYLRREALNARRLVWRNLSGEVLRILGEGRHLRNPELAGNGLYVAAESYETTTTKLRVFDLARGREMRVAHPNARSLFPVWTPDSRGLAFAADPAGTLDIFVGRLESAEDPSLLYSSELDKLPNDWSPDGRYLLFTQATKTTGYDIWALDLANPDEPTAEPLVMSEYDDVNPRLSPSGDLMAYASRSSGRFEVYVTRFSSPDSRCQVSTEGGYDPYWGRHDGRLYYLDPAGRLLSSAVNVGDECQSEAPRLLFETEIDTPGASRNHFAVSAEGEALFVTEASSQDADSLYVVLNLDLSES